MAISTYPAASAGGIKSVQRGSAGGAGNVTITAVDISKSFVTVFGTTSSGTVAASGTMNASNGNINASNMSGEQRGVMFGRVGSGSTDAYSWPTDANTNNASTGPSSNIGVGGSEWRRTQNITGNATTFAGNSTNLTGGSNNLVAAVVQGYLSNSTTLVVSGACRWEVVEFN